MVSSTAVFTKAKHSHLRLLSSSFQYHHKLKEAPRPHLLTHYFTDPSSANPRRHVTVMQCFTCQPNRSPRPLSQHFSQKSEGILYIWAVYISDLLVIVRYFASFTSNQGLVMRSLHFFFSFFFFVWCLGFRIWFNCINPWLWVLNLWWWSLLLCFFFFFVWCLGKHLIWSIETRGYGFSTRGEPMLLYFFLFFSLFNVWVCASGLYHFGAWGDGFSTRGDEVYIFYIWVFNL